MSWKEVNKVYRTKDYSIFKFHKENRTIKTPKVNYLKGRMMKNGWAKGSHLTVNHKYEIIDGQHRLLAAMEVGVPVDYVMYRNANGNDIRELNMGGDPWRIMEHLDFGIKQGNQNYILLDRFMKNFPHIRPTDCTMLTKNSTSYARRREFEEGEFKVKDMKIAYEWGHNIMSLKPYFDGYKLSLFVRSMITVLQHPEFKFDEFLHRVKTRRSMIYKCGTLDQYLEMIEKIYNFRRPADERIILRRL